MHSYYIYIYINIAITSNKTQNYGDISQHSSHSLLPKSKKNLLISVWASGDQCPCFQYHGCHLW